MASAEQANQAGARRWKRRGAAVAVAPIACLASLLLLWWQPAKVGELEAVPVEAWACLGVLAAGALVYRGRSRILALLGVKHFWAYPPLWPGVLAGVGGACAIVGHRVAGAVFVGLAGVGTIAGVVCIAFAKVSATRASRPGADGSAGRREPPDVDALREWLASDTPVADAKTDSFGHGVIARRMAARLVEDPSPSQALIGGLGAGKTTIRRLVERHLAKDTRLRVVPVELWPFDTPHAAVEGIIGHLVDALAREVNVLRLRGVPKAYTDAIAAAGGPASILGRLSWRPSSPFETLRLIDNVLTAIGLRYVVWVEDLERFACGDPTKSAPETPEVARHLAPIRALLFGLDRLAAITVVTATTTLHQRFDLEKIARYVEIIPPVDPDQARRLVCILRNDWQATKDIQSTKRIIDPAPARVRAEAGWEYGLDEKQRQVLRGSTKLYSLSEAILHLCHSPRLLKQTLRRTDELWAKLPGEIDYDAALAMTAIRECSPTAFAIVENRIDEIRSRTDDDPIDQFRAALESAQLDPKTCEAVSLIVEKTIAKSDMPQGFSWAEHADYWQRFMSVPDDLPIKDQEILRAIEDDDTERLAQLLPSKDLRQATIARLNPEQVDTDDDPAGDA